MIGDERGLALTETLLLGLLLFVPLIWTLGVLADLHRVALATTAAVRDAGVVAARAISASDAAADIDAAVMRALRDHGLEAEAAGVRWAAAPRFERGARVEIRVRYPVTIAQAPLLGSVDGPSIWVDARHVARLHPFVSRP